MNQDVAKDQNRRLRVLQVLPSVNLGGAESMVLTLLDELDPMTVESSVCVLGHGPMVQRVNERRLPVRQIRCYRGRFDPAFLALLLRTVREFKPDIIHAHIWIAGFYAVLCARALRVPAVVTFHSNYQIESLRERCMLKAILLGCKRLVFVCNQQRMHFAAIGVSEKIAVVRNGITMPDTGVTSVLHPSSGKCRELGLAEAAPVIVCVANLRPVKGHMVLLPAFQRLLQMNTTARLVLIGDGPLRSELEAYCCRTGLKGSVCFLGARDDVLDWLCAADLFVCSSSSEALSISIMEAMAMGVPVVATRVGGNPELIDDGIDGLLVPYGEPDQLADAMNRLLSDRAFARQLAQRALAKARAWFASDRMADSYMRIYRAVAQV
jgi:glycosyltransferase involved in cell wall biosynthesis